jgi:hypothetical protein
VDTGNNRRPPWLSSSNGSSLRGQLIDVGNWVETTTSISALRSYAEHLWDQLQGLYLALSGTHYDTTAWRAPAPDAFHMQREAATKLIGATDDVQELRDHIAGVWEQMQAAYIALSGKERHSSSCATSLPPAYPPGPCDCSVAAESSTGQAAS